VQRRRGRRGPSRWSPHGRCQPGTRVTLTLDIAAALPIGFDDRTTRVVKENAATLKFKIAEFETE